MASVTCAGEGGLDPVDAEHDVVGLDAGRGRRPALGDRRELDAVTLLRAPGERVDAEQERDGDQEVHHRAGADDQHPPAVGLLAVGAGLVGGFHLVDVAHADDPDERAERSARTPYSTSPRLKLHSLGPKPMKNWVTFMPAHLAVM